MARTREFDTEAAVSRAMELFWTRGYEATTVRDLTQLLGLGQGSLYAAFGDRDGLYGPRLKHYRAACERLPEDPPTAPADSRPRCRADLGRPAPDRRTGTCGERASVCVWSAPGL
ncbi:helix-turn-helix domain-containing protein [Nonomuraea sp. B10E15]|uniref:helix-turn-helix domain-containing protein n=1 Tax=Nonomuraea sp. B10E15 TaxID=3153560 RepID=UPI00325EB81A